MTTKFQNIFPYFFPEEKKTISLLKDIFNDKNFLSNYSLLNYNQSSNNKSSSIFTPLFTQSVYTNQISCNKEDLNTIFELFNNNNSINNCKNQKFFNNQLNYEQKIFNNYIFDNDNNNINENFILLGKKRAKNKILINNNNNTNNNTNIFTNNNTINNTNNNTNNNINNNTNNNINTNTNNNNNNINNNTNTNTNNNNNNINNNNNKDIILLNNEKIKNSKSFFKKFKEHNNIKKPLINKNLSYNFYQNFYNFYPSIIFMPMNNQYNMNMSINNSSSTSTSTSPKNINFKKSKKQIFKKEKKNKCPHCYCDLIYQTKKQLVSHHGRMNSECQKDTINLLTLISFTKKLILLLLNSNKLINNNEKINFIIQKYENLIKNISIIEYAQMICGNKFNNINNEN